MARLITVHGTFAHMEVAPGGPGTPTGEPQWWEADSAFTHEIKRTLHGADGTPVDVEPHIWSGDNSERGRRVAGQRLLNRMRELEDAGESYAVIGHSHGGSVVSAALLEAARHKQNLPGLKRWITVGTPFVELRRERFLFFRLPLLLKALFVASLMLLFMFGFTVLSDVIDGTAAAGRNWGLRTGIGAGLTLLPFLIFLVVAILWDRQRLFRYRPSVRRRARDNFADRWLPLTHEDDEAVSGLSSLADVNLNIFHRDFAVPVLSLLSVFILPIAYLLAVTSPGLMVSLADTLKTRVYQLERYERDMSGMREKLREVRQVRREIRSMRQAGDEASGGANRGARMTALREKRRQIRQELRSAYPRFEDISRAVRFKRRFLEERGRPCPNNQLCGGGYDIGLNSKLLFHLVTDEASTWVLDPELRPSGRVGRIIGLLIPVLLVPVVFAGLAIALVYVVQGAARFLSAGASRLLDRLTWFEINRTALGNDTEAEVALRALAAPPWTERTADFLPPALADPVAAQSNEAASVSIAKFRNALSEIAFGTEVPAEDNRSLLTFLTWKELIHMVYFDVAPIRHVIVAAVGKTDGFKLADGGLDAEAVNSANEALVQIEPRANVPVA